MGWWKADPVPPPSAQQQQQQIPSSAPSPSSSSAKTPNPAPTADSASSCPVDPQTRSIWLQAARSKQQITQTPSLPPNHPTRPTSAARSQECSSDRIDQSLPTPNTTPSISYAPGSKRPLSNDREVSSIPRGQPTNTPPDSKSLPSNSETETGHDKRSGNWIYPSETQFFNAVMRKQTSANPKELATSISSIIPIHNAVNERAWHMIRAWEGESSDHCGGPKLLRFEGKGAGAKSPRAWIKSWSGYTEPFDRHDWTVQRCDGTEVEYVIDFYQGKAPGMVGEVSSGGRGGGGFAGAGMGGINFFLDVRPKLNSVEGCRMRLEKVVGWR